MDAPGDCPVYSNGMRIACVVGNKDDRIGVSGRAGVLDKKEGLRGNKASILITIVFELSYYYLLQLYHYHYCLCLLSSGNSFGGCYACTGSY